MTHRFLVWAIRNETDKMLFVISMEHSYENIPRAGYKSRGSHHKYACSFNK